MSFPKVTDVRVSVSFRLEAQSFIPPAQTIQIQIRTAPSIKDMLPEWFLATDQSLESLYAPSATTWIEVRLEQGEASRRAKRDRSGFK